MRSVVAASAPSRRYPPARYAEVARRLVADDNLHLAVTGSADEHAVVGAVCGRAHARVQDLAGMRDLGALAALIARGRLLISNNTGPVHIAAAVGTPVVDLYALTNPQHTPWKIPNRVLFHDVGCRYCDRGACPQGFHDCRNGVMPVEVVAAARELLAGESISEAGTLPLLWPPTRGGARPASTAR